MEAIEHETEAEATKGLPKELLKIQKQIYELKTNVHETRSRISAMNQDIVVLEKLFTRHMTKLERQGAKQRKPRKCSGFASPMKVSNELCMFLGKPEGTLVSRTETTKFLNKYIKEHGLQQNENKSFLVPDEQLSGLLGINNDPVNFFSLQTLINPHFNQTA